LDDKISDITTQHLKWHGIYFNKSESKFIPDLEGFTNKYTDVIPIQAFYSLQNKAVG